MVKLMNRVLPAILLLFFIFGCDLLERYDSQFNNYSELTNSKSWKGGWVPKQIPKDAVNIKESHYIDRSSVILAFDFSEDFKGELDKNCDNKNVHEIKFANIDAKWWPNSLKGSAFASSHEHHFFSCPDIEGYFAIPFGSEKVYYWRS